MPVPVKSDLSLVQQETRRNEDRIKLLEIALAKLTEKQEQDIATLYDFIDEDGLERDNVHFRIDRRITWLSRGIDFLESFIKEKLAPDELEQFEQHVGNNRGFPDDQRHSQRNVDDSAVLHALEFNGAGEGGKRKRRRRTRKKKTRKSKKKTKRKI